MHFSSLKFSSLRFSLNFYLFLAFIMPLSVRVLPEILMREYLVGFDTISYYVPVTWKWINNGISFWEFFGYAPLLYLMLSGLTLAGGSLIVLLKVLPPILHGFLGVTIFWYATRSLGWSSLKGLFVSLLSTLYFVGLRISWDMLRTELGLIFLFVFLIFLNTYLSDSKWRIFVGLLSSSVLVVLSHQLVSIIMFTVVFGVFLEKVSKHDYSFLWHLLAVLPAALLFGLTVYADYVLPAISENFVSGKLEWLSLLGFSSISDGIVNAGGFLFFCYLPLFPFIFAGIRKFKHKELKFWFIWCLVGIALPFLFSSAPLSYRWVLLLAFPFAFFSVEGFERLNSGLLKKGLVGFAVLLSFSFIFLPAEMAFPYFSLYPYNVPSSMLQNSAPLSDCEDVVKALNWVKANVNSDGILLVHDAFYGWALLCINDVKIIRYGYASPETAALAFSEQGYKQLYVIWWVSGEGWHGQSSLPSSFREVFHSGGIAVYEFEDAA
jgi:hypothetical protein